MENHTLVSSTKISESKEIGDPASRFLLISPIPAPALGWTFPVHIGLPQDASSEYPGVQFAVLTLVGFNDVEITPGATRTATFEVTKKQLSFWRQSDRTWNLARGKRDIWIGSDTETKLLEGKLDI